ncbi:hypothetical protein NESM_000428100 [Novymonas esmeraldas]|uniref:Telomeric single stranded DNA binding POT1/Cdc13 domain-containing protein n=1 Tax=Novymonas esmeraldas TaxID=1808958 RepID=A0AAW0ELS3_9TRYP
MEAYETDASLAQLPKGAEFPELILRCTVIAAVALRPCEFSDDKVFTVLGSVAPRTVTADTTAASASVRINFYNAWAAAAAFLDPGDVLLLCGFSVQDTPRCAGGGGNGGWSSAPPPVFVRPLLSSSTLRVLQRGEKELVMEVSVSPQNWDAVGVRGLPESDTANHDYARTCWGWAVPSAGGQQRV